MPDEPAYVESLYVQHQYGWAPLHGLRTAAWKLIDAPRPSSTTSRRPRGDARSPSGRPGASRASAESCTAMSTTTPDARSEVDPEVAERLAALGYLGTGGSRPRPFGPRSQGRERLVTGSAATA